MNIQAVCMIRNEIDIIASFLKFHLGLFDRILVLDMQSSDGTLEIVKSYAKATGKIDIYNLPYRAKYQAESLTCLAKTAFENNADWVFFLDADEFIKVEDRKTLVSYLGKFGGEVMHLPWINLVPSSYGTFTDFNVDQDFYWTGTLSNYVKISVSAQYYISNPNFMLEAGNHNIRPCNTSESAKIQIGLPLFHLPVRSVERIKYKAVNALELQARKHNQKHGEGFHHSRILNAIENNEGTINDEILNGICMDYGSQNPIVAVDPMKLGWPKVAISGAKSERPAISEPPISAVALRKKDALREWRTLNQPKNAHVAAKLENQELILLPQSIHGNGDAGPLEFSSLEANYQNQHVKLDDGAILNALCASQSSPPFNVFSAWTNLVPALGMIFATLRPRRYVELGSHNGMSFFSACQFSEMLNVDTQCIAVDSWEGDPHAGMHSDDVFTGFVQRLHDRFPSQLFIRTYFEEAARVFDENSIDLIHIDGFHSYEAVKNDFETWLPKMTDRGVMIFHDTNVHERGFGVWRFWEEITKDYLNIELKHGHGLGILYVGEENSDVGQIFEALKAKPEYVSWLKRFLEAQVEAKQERKEDLQVEANNERKEDVQADLTNKANVEPPSDALIQLLAERTAALNAIATDKWWRRTRHLRKWSNSIRKLRGRPKKRWPGPV
jgi:hypothetical protein